MRLQGWTSFWGVAVIASGLTAASLLHPSGLPRLRVARHDVERYQAENDGLRRENARLKREIELLQTDAYLERIVREELGYVRPDEVLFQLR
jgi:cell division protein FtsB